MKQIILILFAVSLSGQTLVTVTGPIRKAGGVPFTGKLSIANNPMTCGGVFVPAETKTIDVVADNLSVQLYATAGCTPAVQSYAVRFVSVDGTSRPGVWIVPASPTSTTEADIQGAVAPAQSVSVLASQLRLAAQYTGKCLGSVDGVNPSPMDCSAGVGTFAALTDLPTDNAALNTALGLRALANHNHSGVYEPADATIIKSGGSYTNPAWLSIDKTKVGLPNVDNTSDENKPISTATSSALAGKQSKIVVSVKDHGAVGDGVADDTAAIQAAKAAGKVIEFPYGTYKTSGTITLGDNEGIIGNGSSLVLTANNQVGIRVAGSYGSIDNLQVTTSGTTGTVGFKIHGSGALNIFNSLRKVRTEGCDTGLLVYSDGAATYYNTISDLTIRFAVTGVNLSASATINRVNRNTFNKVTIRNATTAFDVVNADTTKVFGLDVEGVVDGVVIQNNVTNDNNAFYGLTAEAVTGKAVKVLGTNATYSVFHNSLVTPTSLIEDAGLHTNIYSQFGTKVSGALTVDAGTVELNPQSSATQWARMDSNAGYSGNYNGTIIANNEKPDGSQANTALPTWRLDLGGNDGPTFAGSADAFSLWRKPAAGAYANAFSVSAAGVASVARGTLPAATSGSAPPSSTPSQVGDTYQDTTAGTSYTAVCTTSDACWKIGGKVYTAGSGLSEAADEFTVDSSMVALIGYGSGVPSGACNGVALYFRSDTTHYTCDADVWTLSGSTYTLPTASATVLGGIKIGSGLSIDGSGVVSSSGGGTTGLYSGTLNFSTAIAPGACDAKTLTATGITTGKALAVGPPAALSAYLRPRFIVTAADVVTVELCNSGDADLTPGSATYSVREMNALGYLTGAATISWVTLVPGQCSTNTITVTGAAAGDTIAEGWPADFPSGINTDMRVTAANTVTAYACNAIDTDLTPTASSVYAAAITK